MIVGFWKFGVRLWRTAIRSEDSIGKKKVSKESRNQQIIAKEFVKYLHIGALEPTSGDVDKVKSILPCEATCSMQSYP